MSNDMDERYATAREHWELREDVAALKADMRQIGPQLTRIETMLAAKTPQQQPAPDTNSLALHNIADAMRKSIDAMANRPTPAQELAHALAQSKALKNGSVWPWVIVGGLVVLVVLLGWKQLIGM